MYTIIPHYFTQEDSRGSITGLLNTGTWREINKIASDAGAVRGKHYHKTTTEGFVILYGRIKVEFRRPLGDSWETDERVFEIGDVFTIEPGVEHTFTVLEDAQWLNLLDTLMDPDMPDFHKYS